MDATILRVLAVVKGFSASATLTTRQTTVHAARPEAEFWPTEASLACSVRTGLERLMNLRHSSAAEECRLEFPEGVLHLFALVLRLQQGSPDLTQQPAFARLEDAAELVENASLVSRAEVAELADAHGSGPCTRKGVGVRVPSSAPIHLKSMIYRHGVHHGVHKTAVLVSIVVSTSPRSFARVLRRTDNPAHAARSPWNPGQCAQKGPH